MAEEYDYLFKSIVVGDGGVGKTALTLRFSKGFFTEDYKMTIGVDFHVKTISIDTSEGQIRCKLQLWDTGGQERFSSIRPMYYRGSLGVVLVFDLTNSASFEHLPQWIEEVRANIKADIPLLLVGNKSDLIDQRIVSIPEINTFTKDFNLYYMETSAKTGEGVGDCFYILACLMIGSDVPEQLIANGTVFSPGQILIEETSIPRTSYQLPEPANNYSAPPVPEPILIETASSPDKKELEPEFEYSAPPVPEQAPEVKYEAPPVPEPVVKKEVTHITLIEPEVEPEISIPEPKEIEFKTPEEILSQKDQASPLFPRSDISETSSGETYKPKAVPFSSNIPIPAPPPEEFRTQRELKEKEVSSPAMPFRVVKKEEPAKPKPASMTFQREPEASPVSSETNPLFQHSQSNDTKSKSESLVDYMPQTIISKKEKKKKAKEKKREQKEKLKLEKEKKKKEKEGISEPKFVKKPSAEAPLTGPSLFQTLTQKTTESEEPGSSVFTPFVATSKSKAKETTKLRIIPNIADIERETSNFTAIPSKMASQKEVEKPKSKDLIICEQCGAILSGDYAFCNKCGNKL